MKPTSRPTTPWARGASNICDAEGVNEANSEILQEEPNHATLATLICILFSAALHWTHSAKRQSTGATPLHAT